MSVESWIDTLCGIWEISDGRGGTVQSYKVYEKSEFPESISQVPCALTYTQGNHMQISAGGGQSIWQGITEFHLTDNVDKSNFPYIMLFFSRIRTAAAANLQLGGLVDHFSLRADVIPNVQGPVTLQYGSEAEHHGIVVYWEVKESEADTVST